ncbi:MAG: rhodanese-like domain-containing protein [Sporichthyaceae bacterium]
MRTAALLTALLLGTGLSACGSDDAAPAAAPAPAPAVVKQVDPAEFETLIKADRGTVINVHVPNEGEIAGTDAHIAYDSIVGDSRLPKNKAAALLIYCRSGNMSAESGRALLAAGYTDVVELRGGFNAWKASGRSLES